MDNDTNPFGTFQPQPGPTFETGDPQPKPTLPAEPSPPRKSRRSRRGAAAPTPASSAKTAKSATAPRRKYTRKASTPVTDTVIRDVLNSTSQSELELVVEIVAKLRALDTKARARITAAIGKLL